MNIANESGSAEVVKTKVGEVSLPVDPQTSVNNHFQAAATDWEHIYQAATVRGRIYQDRMETTLRWIEELGLPATAHLLASGFGSSKLTCATCQCLTTVLTWCAPLACCPGWMTLLPPFVRWDA